MRYSQITNFERCPYQYKLNWIDEIDTIPEFEPDNALTIGTALHLGIEKDVETAIDWYKNQFPVMNNLIENEIIKLENLIPRVKQKIPVGQHEVKFNYLDYSGTVDLIVDVGNDFVDIYDFKYSNNQSSYLESGQLHWYKYMLEKVGYQVRNLYFVFVPKTQIKQKKNEDLYAFRKRIVNELNSKEIEIVGVKYDENKVNELFEIEDKILTVKSFEKNPTYLCNYCKYQKFCEKKGESYMLLPKCERRKLGEFKNKKIWIYGKPFSGKTTMLDKAPNPLNLNTDGNISNVTMQYIRLKDEVKTTGRLVERKFAWEIFKEIIEELEKKDNDFKTIIIDLVEDTREMCRLYKYDKMGIEHESDSGYGKGWDIIKTEYLSTMRRFFNLDYENLVIISHEVIDTVIKKNGQTITTIAPNIPDKVANKLCGMVDIVARVVVDDDGTRTLNFKANEFIFGGGRITNLKEKQIPLDWNELMKLFENAEIGQPAKQDEPKQKEPAKQEEIAEPEPTPQPAPARRKRKVREE